MSTKDLKLIEFGWVAAGVATLKPESETVEFGDLCPHLHETRESATACGGKDRPHTFRIAPLETLGEHNFLEALAAAAARGYGK